MTAPNMAPPYGRRLQAPDQPAPRVRLPLAQPRLTYVFLGLVAVVFVLETVLGGSTNTATLERLGAQINFRVADGEIWRLLSAMFLHIGLAHIAFNGWALFSLGRDVEAFYGSVWFAVIYLAAGLFGNIAYYLLGGSVLSAGASGGVFGLIGAEVAYFLSNRDLFGKFGRERLSNLAVLVGINLVFGFTVQGINNYAHLGGLLSGLALGLMLAPRYKVAWALTDTGPVGTLVDRRALSLRLLTVIAAVILLAGGVLVGNQRWAGSADLLRQKAEVAMDAGDLAAAQQLLEQALEVGPNDGDSSYGLTLYDLGIVHLQQDQASQGVAAFEAALKVYPESVDIWFWLGLAYAMDGRPADATPWLERFLAQESSGERADYVRSLLNTLR